jgi:hypothetical protein
MSLLSLALFLIMPPVTFSLMARADLSGCKFVLRLILRHLNGVDPNTNCVAVQCMKARLIHLLLASGFLMWCVIGKIAENKVLLNK